MENNENNFRKNSATIYSTQWEIIKTLPKNQRLVVLEMLIDYEMSGIEPDESFFKKNRTLEMFWKMSKPLIDKRVKRAESGRKGGQNSRKSGDSEEKNKQTVSKTKAKRKQTVSKNKQTETKPKADKDKDIDLDIDKEDISKDISIYNSEHSHTPLGGGARSDNEKEDEYPEFAGIGDYDELPVDENGDWIWPEDD